MLEVILHRTVKKFRKPHKFPGHSGKVYDVTFSSNGRLLASVDKTMQKLWDVSTLENLHSITAHEMQIQSVAFKPDGAVVATSSADETIKFWDVVSGREIRIQTQHAGIGKKIAYSQTSDFFAVASNYSESKAGFWEVWDSTADKRISVRTLDAIQRAKENGDYSVAITFDGKQLAIAGALGHVYLFDLMGNEVKSSKILEERFGVIYDLAFSPDRKYLSLGMKEKGIIIWNLEFSRKQYGLQGDRGSVYGVTFSFDGEWLASAGSDQTVRVWGLISVPLTGNRELFSLNDFAENVYDVEFSRDRKQLAAVVEAGVFYLYNPSKDNFFSLAKKHDFRELTKQECETYVDVDTCSPLYQDESSCRLYVSS